MITICVGILVILDPAQACHYFTTLNLNRSFSKFGLHFLNLIINQDFDDFLLLCFLYFPEKAKQKPPSENCTENDRCNGMDYYKTTIPSYLKAFKIDFEDNNDGNCKYASVVEKKWFESNSKTILQFEN